MVGYHVHEKAALLVTVVFALDALETASNGGLYLYLSTLAHYALLPLLFTPAEYPLKVRTNTLSHPLSLSLSL
jgi:alpha-1,3-glucosyltransferase